MNRSCGGLIHRRVRALILSAWAVFGACASPSGPAFAPGAEGALSAQSGGPWLALGDSYTIGEGVPEADRWPAQVRRQGGLTPSEASAGVYTVARTGWTTGSLLAALDRNPPRAAAWDQVSLLIGVNNQYQGLAFSVFERDFELLLDRAQAYSRTGAEGVIVVTIPDYSVTPFGGSSARIRQELEDYNAWLTQAARARGLRVADIWAVSQRAAGDLSLLAADRLHPSSSQYALWAEAVRAELAKSAPSPGSGSETD